MIIDISPLLSSKIAPWPEDHPFERTTSLDLNKGDIVTLSSIQTSLHIGAHVDAHAHYEPEGKTIDQLELERFVGPCQVISVSPRGRVIEPSDLSVKITEKRVLIKCHEGKNPQVFDEKYYGFSADFIKHLSDQGVVLLGSDGPSMDAFGRVPLAAHKACAQYDVTPLEGLVLDQVTDGTYELIALPLKIQGGDGSPVRAVLRK